MADYKGLGRYLEASNPPESGKEAFLMIQARRSGYDSPWAYIFDYMTPNQVLWEKVSWVANL
jgi:hypothetical protein